MISGPHRVIGGLLVLCTVACSSGPPAVESTAADIVVDLAAPATDFDRRLLGTNVPAWIGPERLADPAFQQATVDVGRLAPADAGWELEQLVRLGRMRSRGC